jgi:hypothetical protein
MKILSGQILYPVSFLSGPDISISGAVEYTEKYDDREPFLPLGHAARNEFQIGRVLVGPPRARSYKPIFYTKTGARVGAEKVVEQVLTKLAAFSLVKKNVCRLPVLFIE